MTLMSQWRLEETEVRETVGDLRKGFWRRGSQGGITEEGTGVSDPNLEH